MLELKPFWAEGAGLALPLTPPPPQAQPARTGRNAPAVSPFVRSLLCLNPIKNFKKPKKLNPVNLLKE